VVGAHMRPSHGRSSNGRMAQLGLCLLLGIFLFAVTSPLAAAAVPSLSILTPANDQVIGNGTPVIVSFAVSNFALVQPGRVGQVGSQLKGTWTCTWNAATPRRSPRADPFR